MKEGSDSNSSEVVVISDEDDLLCMASLNYSWSHVWSNQWPPSLSPHLFGPVCKLTENIRGTGVHEGSGVSEMFEFSSKKMQGHVFYSEKLLVPETRGGRGLFDPLGRRCKMCGGWKFSSGVQPPNAPSTRSLFWTTPLLITFQWKRSYTTWASINTDLTLPSFDHDLYYYCHIQKYMYVHLAFIWYLIDFWVHRRFCCIQLVVLTVTNPNVSNNAAANFLLSASEIIFKICLYLAKMWHLVFFWLSVM